MTRFAWMGLVVAAGLSGCLGTNFMAPGGDKSARPVESTRSTVRPPVTAGQINGANAQEKAQALRDELDRDLERAMDTNDGKK